MDMYNSIAQPFDKKNFTEIENSIRIFIDVNKDDIYTNSR